MTAQAVPVSAGMVSGPSETIPAGPVSQPPSERREHSRSGTGLHQRMPVNRESGAVVHRLQLLGAGSASQPRVGVAAAE
jgi:hypothetical protein